MGKKKVTKSDKDSTPFNSQQMNQLVSEYFDAHHISPKPGGWPGFTCFMNPRGEAIVLPKITFSLKKNIKDELKIKELIRREILERINCFDRYYLNSMVNYFVSDLNEMVSGHRDDISRIILSNPTKFQELFENGCEDSDVNEVLQRFLDAMSYQSTVEELNYAKNIWNRGA